MWWKDENMESEPTCVCNTASWCQRIITVAFVDFLQFSETFASINQNLDTCVCMIWPNFESRSLWKKLQIFQVCWWYGGEPWDWEKGQCRKGNWDHFRKSGSPATRANSHYLKKLTNCNKVQIMSLIDSNSLKRFVECCKDNYCFPGIQRKPGAPAKGCWGYKWSGLLLSTQKNNIITKEK